MSNLCTTAVRKIFESKNVRDLKELTKLAERCGYKAVNHNGLIYFMVEPNVWVRSIFTIDDFEIYT